MLAALLTSLAAAAQSCADVGSPELPGTPEGCPAIAQVPDVCEQGLMAAACPLSCGRCPPPLPPAPPGGYSPPPTVEELFRSSAAAVLSHPLGDLSVFESSRLELDPRPLRNFELLGLGVLLAVIALRLLWRLKQCLRWMTRRGGDGPLLAPGATRSDDAAQVAGGPPFVRRQVSVGPAARLTRCTVGTRHGLGPPEHAASPLPSLSSIAPLPRRDTHRRLSFFVHAGHLTTSQLRTLLGRVGIDAKDTVEDRDGLLALLTARGVTHVNADGSPLVSATRHV